MNGNSDWRERFDRLEASHVKLMTDLEVSRRESDARMTRIETALEEQRAFGRETDERLRRLGEETDARFKATDARIEKLVSAIGRLLPRAPEEKDGL